MEPLKLFVVSNKEWLFPTLGLLAAIGTWLFKRSRKTTDEEKSGPVQKNEVNVTTNVTVPPIVNSDAATADENVPASELPAAAKERVTILFIDDDTSFKIVSMLKKAGWKRVSIIADVDRVDHEKIKAADIIFIDVQGVGKRLGFDREGLGLLKAVKMKYPEKKAVIYSAVPLHDIFADEIDHADGRLRKTAEFIQFEHKIEELAR